MLSRFGVRLCPSPKCPTLWAAIDSISTSTMLVLGFSLMIFGFCQSLFSSCSSTILSALSLSIRFISLYLLDSATLLINVNIGLSPNWLRKALFEKYAVPTRIGLFIVVRPRAPRRLKPTNSIPRVILNAILRESKVGACRKYLRISLIISKYAMEMTTKPSK